MAPLAAPALQSPSPTTAVSVNGKAVTFGKAHPVRIGKTLYLPLEPVAKAMSATVVPGILGRTVTVVRKGRHVRLSMRGGRPMVNGILQRRVVYPMVLEGETIVPLAFLVRDLKATSIVSGRATGEPFSCTSIECRLQTKAARPLLPGAGRVDVFRRGSYA